MIGALSQYRNSTPSAESTFASRKPPGQVRDSSSKAMVKSDGRGKVMLAEVSESSLKLSRYENLKAVKATG